MARPKQIVKEVEDITEEVMESMPPKLNSDLQEIQDRLAGTYKKK